MTQGMHMRSLVHAALLERAVKSPVQSAGRDGPAILGHAVLESVAAHRREQPHRATMSAPELT